MGLPAVLTWWDNWQLRILVLGSLLVQGLLFFSAWVRKLHALRRLRPLVWIAYLAGDALAIYALATLFNRRRPWCPDFPAGAPAPAPSSPSPPFSPGNGSLEIMWVPILLIHLGGQQGISAYALEDNELWRRHAINLLSQVIVAVYVFSRWWSGEEQLLEAAVLLFVAGIVKYIRKPVVLKSASFNSMLDAAANLQMRIPATKWWSRAWKMCTINLFLVVSQDLSTSRVDQEVNYSLEEYVQKAKGVRAEEGQGESSQEEDNIVKRLRGLHHIYAMFVDVPAPYWRRLRDLRFLQANDNEAHDFFRRLLDHVFDMLYTSMGSSVNVLNSCINLVFLPGLLLASLVLFAMSHKDGYKKADVTVTYILLASHFILEVASWLFDVPFSRLNNTLERSSATSCHDMVFQHNFLSWSIRKNNPTTLMKLAACIGLSEFTNKHLYIDQVAKASSITQLVTRHVKDGWSAIRDAAGYKRFSNLRGQQALRRYYELQWVLKMPFDQSVLFWHIATDLCFQYENTAGQDRATESRLISNYMAYLLFHRPEMLMAGTRSGLFDIANYQLENQMAYLLYFRPEMLKADTRLGLFDSARYQPESHMANLLSHCPEMLMARTRSLFDIANYQPKNQLAALLFGRPEMLVSGTISRFDFAAYKFENQTPSNEPLNIERCVVWQLLSSVSVEATTGDRMNDDVEEAHHRTFNYEPKEKKYYRELIAGPCDLAKSLMCLQQEERWRVIQGVWLEMLCYSASRCRGYLHAKSLGEGGEFLTNVWLLLSYMGMETLTYTIQSPELPE